MRRLTFWLVVLATVPALLVAPAHAARNPCRVACRTTKKTCVQAAVAVFSAAKTACASAATPADRRACKAAARTTRAAAKMACKQALDACVGTCRPVTTTTLPGSACGDAEDAALAGITSAHNEVRAHASPAPSPALPALCYSASIAAAAQSWADGCSFRHDTQRLGNLGLGENLYAAAGTLGATAAQDAVPSWACEAANYDYANNTCSLSGCSDAPGVCGHYTQLVWRSTSEVGCGIRTCTTGSPFSGFPTWTYVVCDYQAPGNVSVCDGHGTCNLQRPY